VVPRQRSEGRNSSRVNKKTSNILPKNVKHFAQKRQFLRISRIVSLVVVLRVLLGSFEPGVPFQCSPGPTDIAKAPKNNNENIVEFLIFIHIQHPETQTPADGPAAGGVPFPMGAGGIHAGIRRERAKTSRF
jgi:hypothetical protein